MIRKEYEASVTVQTRNPEEYDSKVNKLCEEHAKHDVKVQRFFDASIGHCAYVTWQEKVTIPESVKDEYELKGISYCCGECPFYVLQKDKRIKRAQCNKGESVWFEKSACELLYELIEKGEVEL